MILDATYCFDLMAADGDAFEAGTELVERGEVQCLPMPVLAEVHYGLATVGHDLDERDVRNRLLGYPRLAVTEDVARVARRLLADADDECGDARVGSNDASIAAMAELRDDAVLTANATNFERLGVAVETY